MLNVKGCRSAHAVHHRQTDARRVHRLAQRQRLAALVELTVLFSLVLRIFGVTAAVRGRARELPLIGGYSQQ